MKKQGISVILVLTILTVCFYGYRYLKIPVETRFASMIQREDTVSGEAYVVRQEVVYAAATTGTMYNYVSEGSRVGKDMKISTVYHGDVNADLVQELNNIDTKIDKLLKSKANSENFTVDSRSAENKIENYKNKIIVAAIENNISEITEYKNSIDTLISGNSDSSDFELSDLYSKKQNVESQLSNDKNDILSTISGVFSLNIDGLENILTPESIMNYNIADFNSIGNAHSSQKTKNNVAAGESICKVVDNHTWYAVTVVPKEKAEEIKSKKNVFIRFESLPGAEVSASCIYVSQEEENEENALIILKSDRYLEGVYGIRSGKMDIVINRYVGYEIPVYAIRNIQGKQGVVIKIGNSEAFCECDIIYSDTENDTAIIYPAENAKRELSIGDKIILGEKTDVNIKRTVKYDNTESEQDNEE